MDPSRPGAGPARAARLGAALNAGVRRGRWLLLAAPPVLVLAVLGGLARFGLTTSPASTVAWHGPLLISGFFGTVIAVERAAAIGGALAWSAPALALVGSAALLAGQPLAAFGCFTAGSVALAAVQARLALVHRQPHLTWLAVGSALAVVANGLWWAGAPVHRGTPFGLGFLICTILGERLELSRIVPRPATAPRWFAALASVFVAGLGVGLAWTAAGAAMAGGALVGLAAWLTRWDIARVTIRTTGLPRYIAACLLGGYAWLAAGGGAWAWSGALGADGGLGDAALHALSIGFVLAMVFGHAPILLPALTGIRVRWHAGLYAALGVLHVGVALRFFGGASGELVLRQVGGAVAAAALVVFAAGMGWGVAQARRVSTDTHRG